MSENLPRPFENFVNEFPDVWNAFDRLGEACHQTAAFDEKTRRLVKLAIAVGAGLEGGTHSAVRQALTAGVTEEEIKSVAILAITTLGFPSAMRSLTWIKDELRAKEEES